MTRALFILVGVLFGVNARAELSPTGQTWADISAVVESASHRSIQIESVEKLIKNSMDKSKLDKIYSSSIEETKLALKKKSS